MKIYKVGGDDDYENPTFNNWICGFFIQHEYRSYGFSKYMISEAFKFLKLINADNLLVSSYTKDGFERISKTFNEISKIYKIRFKDKEYLG